MVKKLIYVKLGGSVITDKSKPFSAKPKTIDRLSLEIKKAKRNSDFNLILAHGSGSFGHTLASKYKTHLGNRNKNSLKGFPKVAHVARRINSIVMDKFIGRNLPVVSISPLSFLYSGKNTKSFLNPVKKALELHLIPIVYGDCIFDENNGFGIYSGEDTLDILASKFGGDMIIMVSDTSGVLDEKGETIPKITSKNFDTYKSMISGSKSKDVTGGMYQKVYKALAIYHKMGIRTLIINGNKKNQLYNALVGKEVVATQVGG